MAALNQGNGPGDRRTGSSPRPKGRENAKDTLCRNVTIYGHCRYEDKGCAFNHDPTKPQASQAQAESMKKRFNVDSPSFMPATLPINGSTAATKAPGLSPRTVNATPFRPKNLTPAPSTASSTASSSSLKPYNPNAPDFLAPDLPDFLPQSYNGLSSNENSTSFQQTQPNPYEHQYNETQSMPSTNPAESDIGGLYSSDANGFGQNLYTPQMNQTAAHQILQHHLYANLGPPKQGLQPNQRQARDSFFPEDLRQKLQKKSEAFIRSFGSSHSLPPYHTLTPLPEQISHSRHFPGFESSVFKAIDSRDGRTYCLRRIYPFKVDDSAAEEIFRTVKAAWRRVRNGSVVSFHEMYTTSEGFGDDSLIVVSDYHPESVTLYQHHYNLYGPGASRRATQYVPEKLLWKYIVQLATALKAIHSLGMSARLIAADKILVTDEDRIRFNGCAIADILDPASQSVPELQRSDLAALAHLIVSLGTSFTKNRIQEQFARSYLQPLKDAVTYLSTGDDRNINTFLGMIGPTISDMLNVALVDDDILQGHLNRELENSRIVRLLLKLDTINERPEYAKDPMWDDYGPRGKIRLFRDYVFHQVDEQGRPVVDMGHILACLNKLDVGLDEKMKLESRDGKYILLVSFKEMKQMIESAFQDVMRRSRV